MDEAPATSYIYKKFAPIRLLNLKRGRDGRIRGILHNFNLDDPTRPNFVTFSYVWGPSNYTHSIWIDEAPFPVLDNLYPLLQAICDSACFRIPDYHWVWIDSICINQKDEHERAQQVQLMGRIYQESLRTVVWLGQSDERSDRAVDFLCELANCAVRDVDKLRNPSNWEAVRYFFGLDWWRRVWTLQEFVLPSKLILHCGERSIGHTMFHNAMQELYWCYHVHGLGDARVWGTAWGRRRVRQLFHVPHTRKKLSLTALLASTGNYQCHDPRDRIYSLLGLVTEQDCAIVGPPDYNHKNTVEAVYTGFVIEFARVMGSLDIICFAPLFRSHKPADTPRNTSWPSWVPDWRVQIIPKTVPLMVSQPGRDHISCFRPLPWPEAGNVPSYSAGWSTKPHIHFNLTARTLTCRGIRIGVVDGMATSLIAEDDEGNEYEDYVFVQSTSLLNTITDSATRSTREIEDSLVRTLAIDRYDRYLERPAPLGPWRGDMAQLVARNTSEHFRPKAVPASTAAIRWIVHNREFLIRGRTLLDICEVIHEPPWEQIGDMMQLPERMQETIGLKTESDGKVLATLETGHLGLIPADARKGDEVWVLQGCSVPVVLRRNPAEEFYSLVGECYVDNFMDGQAFRGGLQVEDVVVG
ncbi:heterokaryon incompatibility protein-domain-containing protein [Echria macrotheca]|uniref:Heterokaryon incompatibility protein-domain-containing protein n=1 Tax=Echria macrotheca TaxID=438768 RepID=A0AAJ0BIJ9_9PEZI|nr:heterokaryon incompatibility protein-domain-containing protein [Echria macrotheca]